MHLNCQAVCHHRLLQHTHPISYTESFYLQASSWWQSHWFPLQFHRSACCFERRCRLFLEHLPESPSGSPRLNRLWNCMKCLDSITTCLFWGTQPVIRRTCDWVSWTIVTGFPGWSYCSGDLCKVLNQPYHRVYSTWAINVSTLYWLWEPAPGT